MKQSSGRVATEKNWSDALILKQKQDAEAAGNHPETAIVKPPSKLTIQRLQQFHARHTTMDISPVEYAVGKSESRQIAEQSLMSAVALAAAVIGTHFWPCRPGHEEFRPSDKATDGAELAYSFAREAFGKVPLQCVLPSLLTSTDDMTLFIFKGVKKGTKKSALMMANAADIKGRGVRSLVDAEKKEIQLNGRRIKLATTGSGLGQCAPPYVVVTVSEDEMPSDITPQGFLSWKVDGLAGDGTTGFITFLRSDGTDSVHVSRFLHQQDKSIMPFLSKVQSNQHSFECSDAHGDIPDNLRAVCWSDGALDQLEATTNSLDAWKSNKATANKQNAARTGTEQGEDLSPKYPIVRSDYERGSVGTEHLHHSEGLFVWSAEVERNMNCCKSPTAKMERKLLLVDYLMELVYELALAPDDDVSRSPGFETFLARLLGEF